MVGKSRPYHFPNVFSWTLTLCTSSHQHPFSFSSSEKAVSASLPVCLTKIAQAQPSRAATLRIFQDARVSLGDAGGNVSSTRWVGGTARIWILWVCVCGTIVVNGVVVVVVVGGRGGSSSTVEGSRSRRGRTPKVGPVTPAQLILAPERVTSWNYLLGGNQN